MASLKKGGDIYYIRFFRKINGKRERKAFSLGTTLKREAEKLRIEFEDNIFAAKSIASTAGLFRKKQKKTGETKG